MIDHPAPVAGAELGIIKDHALRARHFLDQVLRGIDEGKPELLTCCLRGAQPHLLQLIRSDGRLAVLQNVDAGCVGEAMALRRKLEQETP